MSGTISLPHRKHLSGQPYARYVALTSKGAPCACGSTPSLKIPTFRRRADRLRLACPCTSHRLALPRQALPSGASLFPLLNVVLPAPYPGYFIIFMPSRRSCSARIAASLLKLASFCAIHACSRLTISSVSVMLASLRFMRSSARFA